jgi:hypothetical protein
MTSDRIVRIYALLLVAIPALAQRPVSTTIPARDAKITSADPDPAVRTPVCKTSQLLATEDRKEEDGIDGGLGHHAMTIALENRSSSSCVLHGVPTLKLSYTATRLPFPVQVCANCGDYLFPSQPANNILLEPKRTAYVFLGYDINDGVGPCTKTDPKSGPGMSYSAMTLRLYLPDQRQSPLRIGLPAWRICGTINVTPILGRHAVDGSLPDPVRWDK